MPVTPRGPLLNTLIALGSLLAGLVAPRPAHASEEEVVACVRAAEESQSQRSAHRLRAAFKNLLVCAQSNCPTPVKNDCVFWLAEVEKLVPSVTVQAKDEHGA